MHKVLVIIPAYNESEAISDVLTALHEKTPDYDVLVVNDGSTDNTVEVVKRHKGVNLIQLPFNMGIGSTVQTGYKFAVQNGYDIAVECDADGQHPVHQLPIIVQGVIDGKGDMVIGSRYVADTDYVPSSFRRIGKSLLSRIVDSVVGGGVTDTTSGFRAMNRATFSTFARTYPDDYPEAEALVIMHKHGLKAVEFPVDMQPRQGSESSINTRRAAYYIIKVSLAIFIGAFKSKNHRPLDSVSVAEAKNVEETTKSQ
jgi:glycosyltransferase involved in cell wall biosynthesis